MRLFCCTSFALTCTIAASISPAAAQQLGGGESPEVSFWRILITLLACLLIALLVIWFVYSRNMEKPSSAGLPAILTRLSSFGNVTTEREIEILEVRKLNPQTDICLLRCRESEYLILMGGDGVKVLSERACSSSVTPNV